MAANIGPAAPDNDRIYPGLIASQLGPSPFIMPLVALHLIPTSSRHSLVSLAINYRVQQVQQQNTVVTGPIVSRLHHHRGEAIRNLNDEIGNEATRTSDATICSVIIFLFADVR